MDTVQRSRLEAFVRPLYQDVDGVSRLGNVERVSALARRLYTPVDSEDELHFELMLLFQDLGSWLGRIGNLTRVALATGIGEGALRRVAAELQHLDAPENPQTAALAAAMAVDQAGLRGLATTLAFARREGRSAAEVAREELDPAPIPSWVPPLAQRWLTLRADRRRRACTELLEELDLSDLESVPGDEPPQR
jgi:hypothetical protein